jgi:hypothetical protein
MNFVSNEDYLEYSGQDLNAILTASVINSEDNPAPRFIRGIEEWCLEYLSLSYGTDWNAEEFTEHQKKWFKKGIIYQIDYVLQNGTISNDSGYNQTSGALVPRKVLEQIAMAPNALKCFRLAGLANLRRF